MCPRVHSRSRQPHNYGQEVPRRIERRETDSRTGGSRLPRATVCLTALGQAADYRERRAPTTRRRAGCSQRRPPALRTCPAARRRARANSSASPSHHSASEAIASGARSGCSLTSSARYSANDATTRARRRVSSGCTASAQLKPVARVIFDPLSLFNAPSLCDPAFPGTSAVGRMNAGPLAKIHEGGGIAARARLPPTRPPPRRGPAPRRRGRTRRTGRQHRRSRRPRRPDRAAARLRELLGEESFDAEWKIGRTLSFKERPRSHSKSQDERATWSLTNTNTPAHNEPRRRTLRTRNRRSVCVERHERICADMARSRSADDGRYVRSFCTATTSEYRRI